MESIKSHRIQLSIRFLNYKWVSRLSLYQNPLEDLLKKDSWALPTESHSDQEEGPRTRGISITGMKYSHLATSPVHPLDSAFQQIPQAICMHI